MCLIKKKCLSFLFLPFLLSSLASSALVIEHNDIAQVFTYGKEETLFVFDLDNTLVETAQYLGSDQWFSHQVDKYIAAGHTRKEAVEKYVALLIEIQKKSYVRPANPEIPSLLSAMQKKQVPMIVLTARDPQLAERTIEQLALLNINFYYAAQKKEMFHFSNMNNSLFNHGILFCGAGVDKGELLVEFLKQLEKIPQRIVFVDDKMHYVLNVEKALAKLNIDYIGIRYSGSDERFKNLDSRIADVQFDLFNKILSDEQALHLLKMQGAAN